MNKTVYMQLTKLISEAKLEKVINELVEISKNNDTDFYHQMVLISAEFQNLKKSQLSYDAQKPQRAQITKSILNVMEENKEYLQSPVVTNEPITFVPQQSNIPNVSVPTNDTVNSKSNNWGLNLILVLMVLGGILVYNYKKNSNLSNPEDSVEEKQRKLNEKLATDLVFKEDSAYQFFVRSNTAYKHNISESIILLDSAILLNPTAIYYYYRGKAKIEIKDFEDAISDLNQSNEMEKNNPSVFDHLGLAKLELCKLSENKGQCWEAVKDFEEAIRLYDENKKGNPLIAKAYYNLGLTYEEVKEYSTALDKITIANATILK